MGFWLSVLGVLVATTPSEQVLFNSSFMLVVHFLALFVAIPNISTSRPRAVKPVVIFYLLIIPFILSLSNVADPSLWAVSFIILGAVTMLLLTFFVKSESLIEVIDAVLAINLIVFCIQFLVFFTTNELIQPHLWLYPGSASRSGEFLGFVRLGGLHTEPGTYSSFLYLLVVFRNLLGGRLTDRISILMLISFAATFSAWGIIAFLTGFLSIAISVFSNKRSEGANGLIFISILLMVSSFVLFNTNLLNPVLEYIQARMDTTQGSASYRQQAFDELIIRWDDYFFIGLGMSKEFCGACYSPQDLGLWSQMIVRFGFLSAVFMITVSLISAWKHSLSMCILVAFAFTGKYDLSKPIVWMFFALILFPYYADRFRSPGSENHRAQSWGGPPPLSDPH